MEETLILRKSPAGVAEITQRRHRLTVRLRALLIVMDGCKPLSALKDHLAALGATLADVQTLLDHGLLERGEASSSSTSVPMLPVDDGASHRAAVRRSLGLARLYLLSVMERVLASGDDPVRERLRSATTREGLLAAFADCRFILLELGGDDHVRSVEARLAEMLP